MIAITCENQALQPHWKRIEGDLYTVVARVGWDPRKVRRKLEEIHATLKKL